MGKKTDFTLDVLGAILTAPSNEPSRRRTNASHRSHRDVPRSPRGPKDYGDSDRYTREHAARPYRGEDAYRSSRRDHHDGGYRQSPRPDSFEHRARPSRDTRPPSVYRQPPPVQPFYDSGYSSPVSDRSRPYEPSFTSPEKRASRLCELTGQSAPRVRFSAAEPQVRTFRTTPMPFEDWKIPSDRRAQEALLRTLPRPPIGAYYDQRRGR